jgi:hypothetical protein
MDLRLTMRTDLFISYQFHSSRQKSRDVRSWLHPEGEKLGPANSAQVNEQDCRGQQTSIAAVKILQPDHQRK